jgi:hypothetical protein
MADICLSRPLYFCQLLLRIELVKSNEKGWHFLPFQWAGAQAFNG